MQYFQINKGHAGASRNEALRHANGDFICLLDDDDYWLPTKLEKQISTMVKSGYYFSGTESLYGWSN